MVRPGLAGPRPGLPSLELERDASETLEVVDPQDTSDTADLAPEVDDTLPSETGDAGGQRSFQGRRKIHTGQNSLQFAGASVQSHDFSKNIPYGRGKCQNFLK